MTYKKGFSQYVKFLQVILHSFQKIIDTRNPQNTLNFDLKSIKNWAYQWKMQFNPDLKKQANEIIFSWRLNTCTYPPVTYNNNIATCSHQKQLGVGLDS